MARPRDEEREAPASEPGAAPPLGRRTLLTSGLMAAVALPTGLWFLRHRDPAAPVGRFGALRPDPAGVLDLLEGFRYRILERAGAPMDDGRRVPGRPDGMACFEVPDGALIVMRNHELPVGWRSALFASEPTREAYDARAPGGVTRLVLDARTFARRSSNLVLTGTSMSCSGGASPHGWLSGEEDPSGIHGFVFLCDPTAERVARPERIDAYGRFSHEAVAFDAATGVAYLTEDRPDSCLYRFVPHDAARPFEGRLYAMRVRGRRSEDTAPLSTGERREVDWVELSRTSSEQDDLRHRARALGAATVRRGEGACLADGALYFCATSGGPVAGGQVFRLADEGDGGSLEVVRASTDPAELSMPDNVTVGPRGTLFLAEDGPGRDHVRGVLPGGEVFALARNAASEGEVTGLCFSPDGRALFLNLQEDGLTIVVEGPFDQLG